MEINVAKNSGFCFGANRAVNAVNDLLDKGYNVCTMGEIIHNQNVVDELNNRGVNVTYSVSDIGENSVLVIRSHGVERKVLEEIKSKRIKFIDATCPYVKKIHNIVRRESSDKKFLLVFGDFSHPEVIGIRSYFDGKSYVFKNEEELKRIISDNKDFFKSERGLVLSQTTFSIKKWNLCVEIIKKLFTNIKIYDTICSVTSLRQHESEKLSKVSDLMIVVGGSTSSNTRKLFDICSLHTKTLQIEKIDDLFGYDLRKYVSIGITAGASTPYRTVREVEEYLKKISLG